MVITLRTMLSSAHVLAMDAKNLLDVIDSIRINYPMVDQIITRSANVASRSSVSTSGSPSASSSAASSLEKHRVKREKSNKTRNTLRILQDALYCLSNCLFISAALESYLVNTI